MPAIVGFGEPRPRRPARSSTARRAFLAGAARPLRGAAAASGAGRDRPLRGSPRLPNTSHVAFPGVEGESLLIRLDLAGYAVSTGSACSSGTVEPSKTLLAMGLSRDEALASLRVSFGITNPPDEVDGFLAALAREVAELRRVAPAAGRRGMSS